MRALTAESKRAETYAWAALGCASVEADCSLAAVHLLFDGFELDPEGCQLFRDGVKVPLERRALDLLCYLAAHPQRLIRKEELLEHVWHAHTLSAGVLANSVAKLRKALGQHADERGPIETVRGRGYRWLAVAREAPDPRQRAARAARARDTTDPFVGRRHALEQLSVALERARDGHGQLLVVAGEAGIGKTRLVTEFTKLAAARGFSVWHGAAHDDGAAPAYWPWVELLRAAHEQLSPSAWQRLLPANHAALAQLVPELCTNSAELAADARTLRFKLFDEVTRFLKAACGAAPRLLVIDDLHWADATAIELLAYAARALESHAVLFVATLRDHEVVLDEHHGQARRRLERVATRLALQGLSNDEIAELIAAFGGAHHASGRLIEEFCQRTQGNPLFIRQMWELLSQRGALLDGAALQLSTADLPPALRDVIQQRIAGLGEETRAVLSVAAAVGREFDANLIAEVLGHSLEHVLSAIEPALDARVVAHQASMPPQGFAFTHSLLRDALYDALGVARRGVVHAKLAHALLARHAAGDPRQLGEIARHLLFAVPSQLEACVLHCGTAAAAARASSGFEAAAELLSRLIQKHESEGGDPHTRAELLLTLSSDQFCAGDTRAAWATLHGGTELARQLQSAPLLARFALRLARWSQLGGGDETYITAIVEQAMRALGDDDSDLRASLLAHRAAVGWERPLSERMALLHEAEALAGLRATPEILLQVAFSRAVMSDPVQFAEDRVAVQHFRTLDARHRAYGDPVHVHQAFFVEWVDCINALSLCELEAADAAAARCRAIARSAQTTRLDFLMVLFEAGRALGDGRLAELETHIQRLREASGLGGSLGVAWRGYAVLLAHERRGATRLMDGPVDWPQLLRQFPELQRANLQVSLAWSVAKNGSGQAASQLLASVPDAVIARMPSQRGDLATLCVLAETYHMLDDLAGAARLLPRLEPFAALNAVGYACEYRGSVAHYLGLLAASLGRSAEALAHFERAEELNRKLRMPLQLARTQAQRALLVG